MTYTDCWISPVVPGKATDADAPAYFLKQPERHVYWDAEVKEFANSHNLKVNYTDSCWVTVEVTRSLLEEFLAGQFGQGYRTLPFIAAIPPADVYTLSGESF